VNVAVQLPAPPPPPAPPGPDQAQLKALEDQIDKQKAANKQIEDQIAALQGSAAAGPSAHQGSEGQGSRARTANQTPMPSPNAGQKT
jgi:hypothetical protein